MLAIRDWLISLDNKDLINSQGNRNDKAQADNHREQLKKIIEDIEKYIQDEKYDKAAQDVEKKLIPRTDGCNAGNAADDLILSCILANNLYNASTDLLKALQEAQALQTPETDKTKSGKSSSRIAAASIIDYKEALLNMIADMKSEIDSADDDAFKNPLTGDRAELVAIIDLAASSIEAGDIQSARDIVKNQFRPLVDGGDGGDVSDDLINSWVYSTEGYATLITNIATAIQEMKLTKVSISGMPATLGVGETVQLAAICEYNNTTEIDCSEHATWTISNPALAAISADGKLTGNAVGTVAVTALSGGMYSSPVFTFVDYSGVFKDSFEKDYLDPAIWSDIFSIQSDISVGGGELRMTAASEAFGQLIPIHYFKIKEGQKVEISATLDPLNCSGTQYVQSFGIYNRRTTGIGAGISGLPNGTFRIFMSTSRGYVYTISAVAPAGEFKIVYQNRLASLYYNGAFIGSAEADLENQKHTLYLFGSARSGSTLDAVYRNFTTNLPYPGDYRIEVTNNTTPFTEEGLGSLRAGDVFTLTFHGEPHMSGIAAKLYDANTMLPLTTIPLQLTQTATPGKYAYTGVMPTVSAPAVALSASDDNFNFLEIFSRRIGSGVIGSARISSSATAGSIVPDIPMFLLPPEFRDMWNNEY
ncbi:MAG TPA: Ig-like domain-containing protein [bacterium]|nr:Ig-like domain-containing protein [bacterium]